MLVSKLLNGTLLDGVRPRNVKAEVTGLAKKKYKNGHEYCKIIPARVQLLRKSGSPKLLWAGGEGGFMSTALPRQVVEKAISIKLAKREDLRRWARKMYFKVLEVKEHGKLKKKGVDQPDGNWYRLESDTFARKCTAAGRPELAISSEDRSRMYELHKLGCSFREIEEIFHLSPQSGNGAQRGCDHHAAMLKMGAGKGKVKVRSRMTKAMFVNIAKNFLTRQKPKKAKAVFKEIEAILPNESNRRKAVAAV